MNNGNTIVGFVVGDIPWGGIVIAAVVVVAVAVGLIVYFKKRGGR